MTLEGKCPSISRYVCPYVRPSTKSFSDFIEIWCVDRGRRVMHDGVPYDLIQGQDHGASEFPKTFSALSPPPFTMEAGK